VALNPGIFQRGAITAFRIAGTIPEACTLCKLAYDAQGQGTGGYAAAVSFRALRETYSHEKIDNVNVLAQDRLYLVPMLDLNGLVPIEDDLLDFGNNDLWTIKRVSTDPATATYSLQVRRP
jgi:hypothetical protein